MGILKSSEWGIEWLFQGWKKAKYYQVKDVYSDYDGCFIICLHLEFHITPNYVCLIINEYEHTQHILNQLFYMSKLFNLNYYKITYLCSSISGGSRATSSSSFSLEYWNLLNEIARKLISWAWKKSINQHYVQCIWIILPSFKAISR